MEKEVVTTQSLDPKTVQKAGTTVLISGKSKFTIYLVIFALCLIINVTQSWLSDTESTVPEGNTYENNNSTHVSHDVWSELLISLIPVIILVVIFIFIIRFVKKQGTKNQFEKKARYFTNVTYTINNAFFKKQGDGFENTYQWEEIYKVKETPKFYLVFSERFQAHVIDKAQLDPWQAEEIKEIFNGLKPKVKVSLK